jgi:MFS family permease
VERPLCIETTRNPLGPNVSTETESGRKTAYYGWWIVGISSVFHALFGGLYHTGISVYFLPIRRTFDISSTQMSLAFALRSLEGGIEGPLAGYLVDRFGPRMVIIFGVVTGGIGFILLSLAASYTMFLVAFLALITVGFSAPFHGLAASINLWFRRRLGLAMSLASAGSAIGGFMLTPVVAWIVLNHGWRVAALLSGILILAAGPPLAWLIRRPVGNEADYDERPSVVARAEPGEPAPAVVAEPGEPDRTPVEGLVDFTVGEAIRTRTYWLLALAIGLRLVAQSALTVHMVPILVSRGVGEGMAAGLVGISAFVRLPAMISAGFLADMLSRTKVSATTMTIGVAAAATAAWGPDGLATGIPFAILFAVAQASNSITWALIGQFFGRRNFGVLRGWVTLIQSSMSFAGPLIAGMIDDRFGDYTNAMLGIIVVYTVSAALFWSLRHPPPPERP